MKNDDFGDRMKQYEVANTRYIDTSAEFTFPYLRLDGRSFSKFTKRLVNSGILIKPRDDDFEKVFIEATRDTVKEFSFALGFHQSDEISFFLKPICNWKENTSPLFGGRIDKLLSVVPSYFTARFIYHFYSAYNFVPECSFDCRFVAFPSYAEATNMLVWRFQDATRNVIQDYAHHIFGHKLLEGKSTVEKLEMITESYFEFEEHVLKGYGNFIQRENYEVLWKPEYGDGNIEGTVTRSRISKIDVDFRNLTFDERAVLIYGQDLIDTIKFYEMVDAYDESKVIASSEPGW